MSEALSQQERLQAIAEKRKKQTEIENKRRQLEDDRRQLQHLKSKALRERWLLDGAPSAGSEEDEATKQLQEDEAKTKGLEEAIMILEQELEELETGVSATSTKENLSDAVEQEETETLDNMVTGDFVKAMYSVEITIEKDLVTGETKVLSTNTLLPKDLSHQGIKVYEDEQKVVHEVRGSDGPLTNGVHQLSSSEVEDLIHKADEASMSDGKATPQHAAEAGEKLKSGTEKVVVTPVKEITGVEAKPSPAMSQAEVNDASAEKPVTMVFMGYQDVEDEDETKKVLGLESTTVKAELVVIEDGENKNEAREEQAPPNGGPAEPAKAQEEKGEEKGEPEAGTAEIKSKEKQPCKCCSIM
ncbi:paralemmin 1a isoform X2 [Silurus meridionalis]|uniref:paralemmin 1a isoform X2 n=1 Tax=Silurus meridionalis TaxID=175797 RepID=UPI001EEAE609|nr:paralemmin 1a isoform X2 [Silurus meridionalis]